MKIEKCLKIDDWLTINQSDKEEEWKYSFCTCGINIDRTLSEADELYKEYLKVSDESLD